MTATAQSTGRHRAPGERHALRLLIFGAIGGSVWLFGLALQVALVRVVHLDPVVAYIIQGFVANQLSFLLNRYLTWRDRNVSFWRALWRFNTQKTVFNLINLAGYTVLVRLGVQYLVANVALTAVFTPINYAFGHYWSFKAGPFVSRRRNRFPRSTSARSSP